MDRNSIIGIVLICLVLLVFTIMNQPTQQELDAAKKVQDSIAMVEKKKAEIIKLQQVQAKPAAVPVADTAVSDSAKQEMMAQKFGTFANAAQGDEKIITLENDLLALSISNKGGKIKQVLLKNYKTWDGKPLILNDGDSSDFSLNFFSQNRTIQTGEFYFTTSDNDIKVTGENSKSISLKLLAGSGKYIEYVYTLKGNDYRVGFKINFVNLGEVIAANTGYMELHWKQKLLQLEKNLKGERDVSTIYYRYTDEEVDYLSLTESESEELKTKVNWVAFKQQYFSSVIIADKAFENPTVVATSLVTDTGDVKYLSANFTIPYNHAAAESSDMSFYFGPNHYQTLKKYNLSLEKVIPLGWGIFGWVNRFCVIPVFNFLNGFNLNYGIIILILTILIKIVLLPLTYKSYLSTAKMKVLQPEVTELQTKHKADPMKLQQEMMGLYRKAGVNPMGGCIPMLLQLPILIAMFSFFPASIELRQESFLWATDLSTYDSIYDFGFNVPFYGDHVSLFTILMTISTLLYTMMNSQMTAAATNPTMKWMMYLMPIMFLGIFNNYSAGLSYYYFLANMITFGQQFLFRRFVDEKAIHAQIQENKKKPIKKSGFQERLEKMAKERGVRK